MAKIKMKCIEPGILSSKMLIYGDKKANYYSVSGYIKRVCTPKKCCDSLIKFEEMPKNVRDRFWEQRRLK